MDFINSMNKFFKKIIITVLVITASTAGGLLVSARTRPYTVPNENFPLFGYACNPTSNVVIGCISLNPATSAGQPGFTTPAQPTNFGVMYNPATGTLSGTGYNPVVGEVVFGQQCPAWVTIPKAQEGLKCAKIPSAVNAGVNATNGWAGWVFTGSVTWNYKTPDTVSNTNPQTTTLAGTMWEGINTENLVAPYAPDVGVGRLDFGQNSFIQIKGCTDKTVNNVNTDKFDPFATEQDNSACAPSGEICTNIDDDNGDGQKNEGCPEIACDGLDNDQNSATPDDNGTCNGGPGSGSGSGTGTGAGSGTIKPKYKEV